MYIRYFVETIMTMDFVDVLRFFQTIMMYSFICLALLIALGVHLLIVDEKRRLQKQKDLKAKREHQVRIESETLFEAIRAWRAEVHDFALSLKPDETLLLQNFFSKHPNNECIRKDRPVYYVPHFEITIFHSDFDRSRNFKSGQMQPSMYEVITDALGDFKKELALYRMRKQFVEKKLNLRLNDDCATLIAQNLI